MTFRSKDKVQFNDIKFSLLKLITSSGFGVSSSYTKNINYVYVHSFFEIIKNRYIKHQPNLGKSNKCSCNIAHRGPEILGTYAIFTNALQPL